MPDVNRNRDREMFATGPGSPGELATHNWNARNPIGTAVRYYPIIGQSEYRESRTRSQAWQLGHGEPVVLIEGQTGGVALRALRVMEQS